jgi:DNA-binding CsgD family transcriptional regulator
VGPCCILLAIERRKEQGSFSHREIELLGSMAPHLQRAGQFASRLAEARTEGVLDAFDLLNCGGILIDVVGKAIRLNARAQQKIGRGLSLVQDHLTASHRGANAALQGLIGSVLQPGPAHEAPARGAVAVPRTGGRPLIIHAAPIVASAGDIFQRAKAILMIVDPDEHREPAEPVLRQAFNLTPAEARLAAALVRGDDLNTFASAHKVSVGTARTQMKTILVKTGTHRQAELVALLGSMCLPGVGHQSSG